MYGQLTVAVVIPAFNEEPFIRKTVETLPTFVDHVILVDDASEDQTTERALGAPDPRLPVVRHARNRGVGAAIASGYRLALALGADAAVVVAGDGQMDPSEMDRLLEPIASGEADYVKGDRLAHPDVRRRMPAARYVANRLLSWATRHAVGKPDLRDSQCGYTAASRALLQSLPLYALWPRYGYPNDLLSLLHVHGWRVTDRQVTPIYGDEKSGIRVWSVVPSLTFVLARAWVRRFASTPQSPVVGLALRRTDTDAGSVPCS